MRKVLGKDFFERSAVEVAKDILGKYLIGIVDGKEVALMITEVEAYDGPEDKACHASKGRTARTETLFGEAGRFYVYLVYGIHYLLNIVADREGYPAGVLIRGVEGINGPGKVAAYFNVDLRLKGKQTLPEMGLWVEDRGVNIPKNSVKAVPRVGVEYAGSVWAKKPYRFVLY